jgi:hypothetical protein
MSHPVPPDELPPPVLGPDDPPIDFARELAAYQEEEERLVRDHLGRIALAHGDEVVGAFDTAGSAWSSRAPRWAPSRNSPSPAWKCLLPCARFRA